MTVDALLERIDHHRSLVDARLGHPARWRGPLRKGSDSNRLGRVAAAFDGLVDRYEQGDHGPLTTEDLLDLHAIVEDDGGFRTTVARVGTAVVRIHPGDIPGLVETALSRAADGVEPGPLAAARLHLELLLVHPFRDGNGRTARLAASWSLIRSGYRSTLLTAVEQHPRHDRPTYGRAFKLITCYGLDTQGPWLRMALAQMARASEHATAFREREQAMREALAAAGVPRRRHDAHLITHDLEGGSVAALADFSRLEAWLAQRGFRARHQIRRLLEEEGEIG